MTDNSNSGSRDHLPAGSSIPPDRRRRGLYCQACGRRIPPGGLFYIGRTEIISGSDGVLPDIDSRKADSLINEALKEITHQKSEQELMDEVYQEIRIILCNSCRLEFRQNVFSMLRY